MSDIGLFASPEELPSYANNCASRQFGGIRIFAVTSTKLQDAIDRTCKGILRVSAGTWGLTPSMLLILVQQDLGVEISKRVFSALLGYKLRCGDLDTVICESTQGAPFRVVLHRNRIADFKSRTRETADQLHARRILQISDIRDNYFKNKPKGSWTQAMYVAARLARLGIAEYQDQYTIKMPDTVANALMLSLERFNALDAGRLGSD